MNKIIPYFLLILFNFSCKNQNKNESYINGEQNKTETMNVAFIGTYTQKEGHVDGKAEGIYTIYQNSANGAISFGETVAGITNPSFVITSADRKNLYAVSELGPKDGESGFIHSYLINEDNSLAEIGKISTEGFAPCHISEDKSGRFIFVANYVGGVVMMYEKDDDGSLRKKQKITLEDPENSHPHSVSIADNNSYVYIADLGKSRIYTYILDAETDSLKSHTIPYIQLENRTGPRHFEFSASQQYAFSINEHASTINTYSITASGELSLLKEISTLPEDYSGENSTADIHLHPSGNFLYASNRGHNSIVSYRFEQDSGTLKLLEITSSQGEKPRNFSISPNGKFLYVANQDSDNIVSFEIDLSTGKLKEIAEPLHIKTPVCINFL